MERQPFKEPTLFRKLRKTVHIRDSVIGNDYLESRSKRVLDFALAAGLLPIGYSLAYCAAGINKILQPNEPAFYYGERIGKDGQTIKIKKVRTLRSTNTGEARKIDPNRRYRFGDLMRRWRIDEAPQLVNVLKGETSFVAPRMIAAWDMQRLENRTSLEEFQKWRDNYLRHRPGGVSLPFTLNCKNQTTAQRMRLDSFYANHANLGLDLYLTFILTPYTLIRGRGI